MAIEIKEQLIAKDGLVDKLNELFISTSEYTEQHMDISHCDGMVFTKNKEKKIPFAKFQNLQTRQALRKDFNDFLKSYHIQEEQDGAQFVSLTVFLGVSDGRSRSFYVSDYKTLIPMIRKFAKEQNSIVLFASHFAEKTKNNSSEVEHLHILYQRPKTSSPYSSMGQFLEENYEES